MDKSAPPEVKRRSAGRHPRIQPSDRSSRDMDNWQECTQTCRASSSRRMPLNNQMGLGHEHFDPALGAWSATIDSARATIVSSNRRWTELMEAADWSA